MEPKTKQYLLVTIVGVTLFVALLRLSAVLDIRSLMSRVRAENDGNGYFHWQRNVSYDENDRKVVLITNWENHMTDEEIFKNMKEKEDPLWS